MKGKKTMKKDKTKNNPAPETEAVQPENETVEQPDEQTEILKIAEHYFVKLKGNWYMTSVFSKWCKSRGLKPEWFDSSDSPNE